MKHTFYKYIALLLAAGLFSCQQFKDVGSIEKVGNISATVRVNLKDDSSQALTPESYKIKLNNYTEGYEVVKEAGSDGVAYLDDIIPGIYTVTVSAELSHNGFTYNFNGNLVNINIVESGKELPVEVSASRSGNIILKEIYYCGSRTPKGGSYFRDQYYELYNNTNSVQYLDGLCLGNLLPAQATANLPVWPGEDADEYVYFATIWQVPGSGNQYPLQPGESAIIAQMADNHQREALNPLSPVNLIGAEFETFVKSTSLVLDNPAVNMKMAFWPKPSAQWLVTVFGGAYAIFYPEKEIDPNDITNPVGRTDQAHKIRIDNIMDAVELVNNESKMKLKRVPAALDAGAVTVEASYCSKSVSRKIRETLEDGRIIYMDTNNSTEDFQVNDKPVVRRNNAGIPSWNTWIK